MLHASYLSNECTYEVVFIDSYVDALVDAAYALQDVTSDVSVDYLGRMKRSIDQRLAYRIVKDGVGVGFAYNLFEDDEYQGTSIHCVGDPVATVLLFKTMFEIHGGYKIKVMPHKGLLKYFISVATSASIKEYHTKGLPLVIVKKDITVAGEKAFHYLGIKEI